ncbi:MAG: hypothetical protein N2509_00965 [Treponemataceae bacterium]|nr:hypothetical protein [Treponemataceae bacterium]
MLLHPAILALLVGSILISLMVIFSAHFGILILRKWDLKSGSELQLSLERKTYLISTVMTYAFSFQVLSFFLFIYTADHLSPLFSGAMCAAGTLNVNRWGYPTFLLKIFNFLLAGLWLMINYTDNRAYDYPLIKWKYALLLLIMPIVLAETVIQGNYFLHLQPDIITSCCGSLFTPEKQGITSSLIALPRLPLEVSLYLSAGLTFLVGGVFYKKGRGEWAFVLALWATVVLSALSLISFICLYIYEIPTHHCPFCILQREYGYVGYPLYLTLLGSAVSGTGIGALMKARSHESLKEVVPKIQKGLLLLSLACLLIFFMMAGAQIIFSTLTM